MATLTSTTPRRRVCVWFGEHLIAERTTDPDEADRFEAGMRNRFKSLRVTNEPAVPVGPDADLS